MATIFDKVAADYRIAKRVDSTNAVPVTPMAMAVASLKGGRPSIILPVLTALTQGRAGVRRLLQRLTWWRVGLKSPTMWFASGVVVQGMLALVMFTVLTTSMAFVFTRLFNNTQASLLLCILLHGSVDGSITQRYAVTLTPSLV